MQDTYEQYLRFGATHLAPVFQACDAMRADIIRLAPTVEAAIQYYRFFDCLLDEEDGRHLEATIVPRETRRRE